MSVALALRPRDQLGRFVGGERVSLEVRLWSKVAGPWNTPGVGVDDCWYFGGRAKNRWGYPRIRDEEDRIIGGHIAAFVVTYGRVPDGLVVCHRCNHKQCCNPSHLYAETQSHNVKQAWREIRRRVAA